MFALQLAHAAAALIQGLARAMFKIIPAPTFTCRVSLSRPDADDPVEIDVTWRHKNRTELAAWRHASAKFESDEEWLGEVIAGWGRVVNEDGTPLPYSREALGVLLQSFPSAALELLNAYGRRLADARAKN